MHLNQAVSKHLRQLLEEHEMTQYQLFSRSGVPRSTINNIINCAYDPVKLRIIHEICQGFPITITEFFQSPLFDEDDLDP